ncbi:hypothetical protein GCM10025867_05000 [Frondihabitans sucicola]|uniref:Protein CR006 P-loop domain-containing protein n=1 Tax=Frondihabitans sucicola TaxID=1268041 RepID=A0ABM8GIS1_9MICO|nr:hypothetical protein GCM10025867_05000 [Frondihabitans sucicola]
MFGGAKAEYNASLRNAHLAPDADVWVAAGIRDKQGNQHTVRRDLVSDFTGAADCVSELTIDGAEHADLSLFGLDARDGAIAAPVLLQHTLRYVLSTEPKQRALYFKALLTLTDLDVLRERVHQQAVILQQVNPDPGQLAVAQLAKSSLSGAAAQLEIIDGSKPDILAAGTGVLLSFGNGSLSTDCTSLAELVAAIEEAIRARGDRVFPLSDFLVSSSGDRPEPPDLTIYGAAIHDAEGLLASILPVLSAVMAVPEFEHLDTDVDCPVCSTPNALTPARMDELRTQVLSNAHLTQAAEAAIGDVRSYQRALRAWVKAYEDAVPKAGRWTNEQEDKFRAAAEVLLGTEAPQFALALTFSRSLATQADLLLAALGVADSELDVLLGVLAQRSLPNASPAGLVEALNIQAKAIDDLVGEASALDDLRSTIEPLLRDHLEADGLRELLSVARQLPEWADERRAQFSRTEVIKRLARAERVLKQASSAVLDKRFGSMSESIERWWSTIRPEELVGFAGVKRRAAGAIFVNLVAALQPQESEEAVERDALGVYSDSQLNALGLSTFLARAELVASPFLFLDDPIPGSDGDHRLTFVENTLGALLDAGRQIVLTTYDPKLAEYAQTLHDFRDPISYDLNLIDVREGTEPIQTSDAFSRYMLQGEDGLSAPTAAGRRGACAAYRSAAERLAKQIIATNRTSVGVATSVLDVEKEATLLKDLVVLAAPFVLSADEKGKWRVMPKILNPGNHDDDVPSTMDLKQIRGNLRTFAKGHKAKWGGSLAS